MPVGPDELGDVVGTRCGFGQRADRVDAHDLELGAVLGEAVAEHRVVERAVAAGELDQVVELALEADLLAEHRDAALEAEQRHRDLPAVAGLAEDHRLVRAGAGEPDLVELHAAGELLDRADLDALLVERHQQEGESVVARRAGLGAGDDEDPVGLLRPRRPHLLAVDDPFAIVEDSLGADGGEVGAGAGLGVALAPLLVDLEDLGEEACLLLVGAELDQRRAEQLLAEVVDGLGRIGAGVLLIEDRLLREAEPAAAVLGGPAEAGPAVLGEVLVPGEALVVRVLAAAGAADTLEVGPLAGEVLVEPAAHLFAEGSVIGCSAHRRLLPVSTVVLR